MPATLTVRPRKPQTGGGRRGPIDFGDFGGDRGGGRGDGAPDYSERLRRYRLGLALALVAIVLLFVLVSSAFFELPGRGSSTPFSASAVKDWPPIRLPLKLLVVNTIVLLFSSIAVELARRQAARQVVLAPVLAMPGISAGPRQPFPWLAASGVLGAAFLGGQGLAWHRVMNTDMKLPYMASSAAFYILTGAHAVHLLGGLLALMYAGATTTLLHKSFETRRIAIDVTAWYWHAMAALWVFIFAVLLAVR